MIEHSRELRTLKRIWGRVWRDKDYDVEPDVVIIDDVNIEVRFRDDTEVPAYIDIEVHVLAYT